MSEKTYTWIDRGLKILFVIGGLAMLALYNKLDERYVGKEAYKRDRDELRQDMKEIQQDVKQILRQTK